VRGFAGLLPALVVVAMLTTGLAAAGTSDESAPRRERIDAIAEQTVEAFLGKSIHDQELFEKAHGYAVFSSMKVALGISGGSGSGVAVEKTTDARTYMRMGTAGLGLGFGGPEYRVVLLFETAKAFRDFVEHADLTVNDDVVVFQSSTDGFTAGDDLPGTRFWKNGKLNENTTSE
jgi:lipid-binding SYLF domain-containing protein